MGSTDANEQPSRLATRPLFAGYPSNLSSLDGDPTTGGIRCARPASTAGRRTSIRRPEPSAYHTVCLASKGMNRTHDVRQARAKSDELMGHGYSAKES